MNVKTIKELIRYQKELALMNGVQLTSWEALGYGISSTTKKMLKWLVTNPAGWAILATTAIAGLVKGYDALIGRQEKLARTKIEDLDEDISKYDEEIRSLEELQSKLESAKGNKSELAQIQNELNDAIGETTGLLNGEGKAYDIANAKLKANIELKKQQREQAQKDRIKEKKNLFDDNVYEDGNSWFNTNADSMRWYAQKYQELIKEYENALDDSDIKKMYGSAEDYAFGWLNVNSGAGIKESSWVDYWDEQVQTAYDIFEDTIEDYDGVGGQDFIKNIINNMVRGGSDLSKISDVIFDIINNQDLQDKINEYWASLVDPEIDSEKALNAVKTMIDGIIKQYPQLEAFFTDFYDGIVGGANVVADTVTDTANKIDDSRTKIISSINDMSEGFEELDKIYSSIKDDNPFDFKLLDDDNFKETFSELDSYADFIEQITSNSDDIEACQSAFNNLVSEWITSTNVLDNVTKENEKLTAAMLKQMGVTNADEIAHYALEKAKAKEYVQSKDNINVTEDNINSLINEANTAGITTNAYLELVAKEILFNDNDINTASKCEQILAIAKTAGIASASLSALNSEIANVAGKKIGSGARTEYAQSKGVEVISEKNRKDGKKNGNLYVVGGKEFDDFTEAMQYAEAYNTMQNISSAFSQYTVPTYTGGSKSNSSSSSKDTKETFDWIETKISRLQRSITNFGKTVSATWKSWTDRNSALKSQISAVTSEINLQQQAADKYLSLANGVGLSGTYKELARNGSLNISTITDENTINAIKQYQEYYNAYLDCLDAKQDAENELANLVREDFDMIAKQFDSEMSLVEANMGIIEAYIDQAEMKGNLVSKNYYSAMYAQEEKNLSLLQQKYEQLSNKLSNGSITKGSEEFNNMATEIKEVSKAIIESKTALEEYQKTMRELDWEVFELIQDKIGNVTEESEFLIELLSNSKLFNDDGSITSQGQATLGLHAVNYQTYIDSAEEYGNEIAKIDEKLASDPNNQHLLDKKQEYIELQRESILAAEDEKQAIVDLVDNGYDVLLDYLDKSINKYKELLHSAKDLRDYEKQVSEQTEEIARLQNIINSYNGDTSEEAKTAIQKYTVELKDVQEALEETEYEKYISDQEQMLDAMQEDAEQFFSERLDDTDALISGVIDSINGDSNSIKKTLEDEADSVGYSISESMKNIWEGVDEENGNTGIKGVLGAVSETLNSIKEDVHSMVKDSDTEASKNASNATADVKPATKPSTTPNTSNTSNNSSASAKTITVGGMINASGALIYDYAGDTSGERQYFRNSPYYRVLDERNGYLKVRHQSLSSGTTGWFKKSDVKAYKTGGLVDYTGLAWVDGQKGRPEAFLNENQTELFAKLKDSLEIVSKTNMFDAIQTYAKLPNFAPNTNSNKNVEIHFENMTFPNVKNADDFITDLQQSKRFENIILEITDGKGDLSKYKW